MFSIGARDHMILQWRVVYDDARESGDEGEGVLCCVVLCCVVLCCVVLCCVVLCCVVLCCVVLY